MVCSAHTTFTARLPVPSIFLCVKKGFVCFVFVEHVTDCETRWGTVILGYENKTDLTYGVNVDHTM